MYTHKIDYQIWNIFLDQFVPAGFKTTSDMVNSHFKKLTEDPTIKDIVITEI